MALTSELTRLVGQHFDSLPTDTTHDGVGRHWPWVGTYLALPAAVTAALHYVDLSDTTASPILLAGVSVLGGLLVQVLAWLAGRIGNLADGIGDDGASDYQMALISRLDIARSNVAYACAVSVVLVMTLTASALLAREPAALRAVNVGLSVHLGLTLLLVIGRINSIGQDDRISALTRHARTRRSNVD